MEHDHHNNSNKEEQDHHENHHHEMIKDFRRRFWISLGITIPILALAPMLQELFSFELRFNGDRMVQFALASVIFFYGGWPFIKGLVKELRQKAPGMMTLIALAITVAYGYSSAVVFGIEGKIFFWELASLIVIMLLGHWLEMKSVMGASHALEELASMMPSTARRISNEGNQEEVPVQDLKQEDIVLVKPGESIPADGVVTDGESHVNESMITGESKPVAKEKDQKVIAGSINEKGSLKIKVTQTGEDSYLSKVVDMVKSAQESKSKTQNLANKAAAWLFYVALGSGLATLIVWLSLGKAFDYALERMVTVMIISCPHALGLAVPLVVAISTAVSAKNGLLIRNRTAFENARKITSVVFDKTGTLTKSNFAVTRFKSLTDQINDEELMQLAASLENNSEHPIALGILNKAKSMDLELLTVKDFESITGKGIKAKINEKKVKILSPGSLKAQGFNAPDEAFQAKEETVVFVVVNDSLAGYVSLADEIRPESEDAINTLKSRGIKVLMATGDNNQVAESVAKKLQLDDFYSEVLPEDKQEIIKELQGKGAVVAMTGDGINDAPALAQANIGIAIGSGTDVAAETADIILVNSNPKDVVNLILFGTATYKKIMQNLWWAAGYNIVAVPLAAGVLAGAGVILNPAIGAGLMSISTIIVAINAQLLKKEIKH